MCLRYASFLWGIRVPFVLSLIMAGFPQPLKAQTETRPPAAVKLSLADAMEAALVRSYAMRFALIDQRIARQQAREAYSSFYPKIDANASYQRTFLAPNPFAGSSASALFSGAGAGDWANYNEQVRERRRVAELPNSDPNAILDIRGVGSVCPGALQSGELVEIGFGTYLDCVVDAREQARVGQPPAPDANPFLVDNTFRAGLTLSQILYSGETFAAAKGAKALKGVSDATAERTGQEVAGQVTTAYYRVVLARASVDVFEKSVARSRKNVAEVQSRFREGVVAQFQLLSAEVELANLETQLVTTKNGADEAEDDLAFLIGFAVNTPLILTDKLVVPESIPPLAASEEVVAEAVQSRPDISAARFSIELREVEEKVTFSRYLPELRLVADLSVVGNVPDNREVVFQTPPLSFNQLSNNPFSYNSEVPGFFDESFWGTNFTAGITITWNLFEGFSRSAAQNQNKLEIMRAQIQLDQLEQSVRQEVARERRNLRSALDRLKVQEKNVERAELNYRYAQLRLKEGVSSQLELRDASQQLDDSRFNRLQAVHDYLVARVNYQVAIGQPPFARTQEKAHD